MPDLPPEPTFPSIPASEPVVVPPIPGDTYDEWFLTGCTITSTEAREFNLESFWVMGNSENLSSHTTNNVVRNITSIPSLAEQLGQDFLDANPDIVQIMPQFLAVLAKIATKQGVL